MGVGNLAGADLAKDAAKVEALQIKQDLSAKTLAIAAEQPRGCSAYLKNYLAVEAESLAHNRTLHFTAWTKSKSAAVGLLSSRRHSEWRLRMQRRGGTCGSNTSRDFWFSSNETNSSRTAANRLARKRSYVNVILIGGDLSPRLRRPVPNFNWLRGGSPSDEQAY